MIAEKLIDDLINVSEDAGKAILQVYGSSEQNIQIKGDNSPLTDADRHSNEIISSFLQTTGIPVLSEEGKQIPYKERKNWDKIWIVDPLDGTKEFLHRNGEFTTNIALVEKGKPILGVVYAPVLGKMYWGYSDKAFVRVNGVTNHLSIRHKYNDLKELMKIEKLKVVASRSHLNQDTRNFLNQLVDPQIVSMGSSLKLMMIAEGIADIYPRFAPTSEWDIAAGHAIVRAAGGNVLNTVSNEELTYNKMDILNPWFYCF